MADFTGRKILLGVSGGIAAYKAAELTSRLAQSGAEVHVVLTEHATEFVGPVTFQALSGNPVYTRTFAAPEAYGMGHLSLAGGAAAMVVAPATANVLAKAAAGIADDLLTTTLLSVTCPVLWAPAMNPAMWAHPLTQRNVAALREIGHRFVGPDPGWLACRDEGAGRLAEPMTILAALHALLTPDSLAGRRVLVTAGPTREHLDAVRFLSNPSSGKQGYALAEEAAARGAEVTLISGPTALPAPFGVTRIEVTCAEEMLAAARAAGEFAVVIGAAAVADHRPADRREGKPAKAESMTVELVANPDILATLAAARRPGQVYVGFAAEVGGAVEKAREKLARKGLDLIVANDVGEPGAGFGGDTNRVTILGRDGSVVEVGSASKRAVAAAVWDAVEELLASGG